MTVPSTTAVPAVPPPAPHTRPPAEAPDAPQAVTPPARRRLGTRRGVRFALAVVPAVLALPLVTAAHHSRQAPFGDRLTSRPAAAPAPPSGQDPVLRAVGPRVEAHDRLSGALRWVHERSGRRPLAVAAAPGHAFALWNDGLVTDTESANGRAVRWHRALPGLADWLAAAPGRGAGVLQLLDPEARMLAVVAPERITAYRTEDGDLRWVLPAARGCAFDPGRHVRTGGALLIAQPCAGNTAWTAELKAVDGLGRIVPGRTPLGNDLPGHRLPELPEDGQRKAVARHG